MHLRLYESWADPGLPGKGGGAKSKRRDNLLFGRISPKMKKIGQRGDEGVPKILLCRSITANLEVFFTARKRSLMQGNVFTHLCHSVHRGRGLASQHASHVTPGCRPPSHVTCDACWEATTTPGGQKE